MRPEVPVFISGDAMGLRQVLADLTEHGTFVEASAVTLAAVWVFPRLRSWWGRATLLLGVVSLWGTNVLWSTLLTNL